MEKIEQGWFHNIHSFHVSLIWVGGCVYGWMDGGSKKKAWKKEIHEEIQLTTEKLLFARSTNPEQGVHPERDGMK